MDQKFETSTLYVHIPFCSKKCYYCSFVVSVGREHKMHDYVSALEREMANYKGRRFTSVYFGGGTPSKLNGDDIDVLCKAIRSSFVLKKDIEWTCEMNPEDVTKERLVCLKRNGINRISLGVQTFHDKSLKYLGRNHTGQEAVDAFECIRDNGFDNVSVDLMFGYKGQDGDQLEDDLNMIAHLDPAHVSLYGLSIEANSRFFITQEGMIDDEIQGRWYQRIIDRLNGCGIQQYEVSNFAKRGYESKHNMNYWRCGDYIGLGIGAHSHENGRRFWNTTDLGRYISSGGQRHVIEAGYEVLNERERFKERLLFGLRMNAGFTMGQQDARNEKDEIGNIERFINEGLINREGSVLKVTNKGRLVLDEISAYLM